MDALLKESDKPENVNRSLELVTTIRSTGGIRFHDIGELFLRELTTIMARLGP